MIPLDEELIVLTVPEIGALAAIGAVGVVVVAVLAVALCRAAARSDEEAERSFAELIRERAKNNGRS